MLVLSIIYFAVGIFYILREIGFIRKAGKIHIATLFRVMYAILYGFFPAIFLYRIDKGTTTLTLLFSEDKYIFNMSIMLFISILEYAIFNLFYKATKESKYHKKPFPNIRLSTQKIAITFVILFGIVSLFLWTRAFGSVWNFIENANSIRSNNSKVYNPVAFMEHFTKVFIVAFFVSISVFMCEKRENKVRFYTFILVGVSLFFSLVVMMCTDSRVIIGILVVVIALYYFNEKIANSGLSVKKAIFKMTVVALIVFVAIVSSEGIMNSIRGIEYADEYQKEKSGIIDSVEIEFGYAFQSQVVVLDEVYNNPVQFIAVNDVVGAVFCWLPSRFIPFELPIDVWDYNTQILGSYCKIAGQAPTDFVTFSLYSFSIFGIFILPAIFGIFLKKLDTFFRREKYSPYLMALYAYFMYYAVWWVSHLSLRYTVLSLFGMFIVHIAVLFFYNLMDKDGELN